MSVDHVILGNDGRIVVPVATRRKLGLKAGDVLTIESDGTSLLIRSYDAVIRETQQFFQQFVQPGESVVDELIAERRVEAARDDSETAAWLAQARHD